MRYEEVYEGQHVKIVTPNPKHGGEGIVHAKERIKIGAREVERVYVNSDKGARRLCSPSVLRPL